MAQKATTQTCVLALAATALEAALLSATDMDRIAVIPCLICGHGVSDDFQVFQECEDCGYEARRPLPSQEAIVVTRSVPAPWGPFDCKHYVLGSTKYPTLFKTGRTTKTVDERLWKIMSVESADLGLYVRATHHYEGDFEQEIRTKLDTWGYQKPPVEWSIKGTEFRVGCFEGIMRAIDAVKQAHGAMSEAVERAQLRQTASSGGEEEARATKKRRIDLQLRREAVEVEGLEFKLETAKFEFEVRKRDYELDWEGRRLALDIKKKCA